MSSRIKAYANAKRSSLKRKRTQLKNASSAVERAAIESRYKIWRQQLSTTHGVKRRTQSRHLDAERPATIPAQQEQLDDAAAALAAIVTAATTLVSVATLTEEQEKGEVEEEVEEEEEAQEEDEEDKEDKEDEETLRRSSRHTRGKLPKRFRQPAEEEEEH